MNLIENGDVIVGFRPEHLVPIEAVPEAAIKLQLRIKSVEYLGSEWIVYGKPEGHRLLDKDVIARLPSAASYKIGELYQFGVGEPHLRFFDRETQKRTATKAVTWQ
jgi:multiple sugar transport system ATP-binding protein